MRLFNYVWVEWIIRDDQESDASLILMTAILQRDRTIYERCVYLNV